MEAILEKVDDSNISGIHAFIFEGTHFDMPWHFHPEFEFTYILESSGTRYVGNNISDFEPGDLVMIGGNLPHCWKNENDHSGTSRSIVIQWKQDIIHDLEVFRPIQELLLRAQRGIKFRESENQKNVELMQKVVNTQGMNQYLTFMELMHNVAQQNDGVYLAGPSYSYDLSTTTTTRIEAIQTFVNEHYMEKIKLSDAANHLHLGEQAFSRFFSKTMNRPFFVFLNEYRVNRASRLILESDLQMSEIAYKCGYDSLPFFYKQFKKFKGYTPLDFRKKYVQAGNNYS